jgi:hypothetical protein
MDRALYTITSIIVPLAATVVGLYYSTIAMSRIGWPVFRYWVAAASLSILGLITLHLSYVKTAFTPFERHEIWVASSLLYTAAALLNVYGTVSMIRRLLLERQEAKGPESSSP